MTHFCALMIGISAGVRRYFEKSAGIQAPQNVACYCVNLRTKSANPNCKECFGTGVKPKGDYATIGIIKTYHYFESPLRHLKPFMTEDERQAYRHDMGIRNRQNPWSPAPGPSYREYDCGFNEPYEPVGYDQESWDA